ncbi:hypothetical protein [Intestinibacter sp.]|uniref:hypothetical protein n=1 Tax=Intestinibacter sp. TaxID=1965304 RepID=UPI003F154F28
MEKKIEPVDVHNDELMVSLGIRVPLYSIDYSVFEKTDKEKEQLRTERAKHKEDMRTGTKPIPYIPIQAKLVVYLKKNNKFPNSTYSSICMQHEIFNKLGFFAEITKSGNIRNLVSKYSYNGKMYKSGEYPFWHY